MKRSHGMPFGAEYRADGSVRFRLWAPVAQSVAVCLSDSGKLHPAARGANGFFESIIPRLRSGTQYKFQIDGDLQVPDPASRYQPDGPHGASQIVDPASFTWRDDDWRGIDHGGAFHVLVAGRVWSEQCALAVRLGQVARSFGLVRC